MSFPYFNTYFETRKINFSDRLGILIIPFLNTIKIIQPTTVVLIFS